MSNDSFETHRRRLEALRPSHEKMVDADINRCEEYLSGERNEQDGMDLHLELITKYPPYISDFGVSLYNFDKEHGFVMREYFDQGSMIANLTVMKSRLVAFKSFGYRNGNLSQQDKSIKIDNTLTANQSQTVAISFEAVKRKIEEMSALSDTDTEEALEKIDEIRAIVELKTSPKSKWQKIKPILAWIADKSVDIGIALLPLILQIGG
ncbi:MAG: hypothetical protein VB099_11165 [Candidatus Limiplasma sp.]|nr:hypothetical protein [Candidatus Limiplasma sp.]